MKTVIKKQTSEYVEGSWRDVDHGYAGRETYSPGYFYEETKYQLKGKRKWFHKMRELRKYYNLKGKVKFKVVVSK